MTESALWVQLNEIMKDKWVATRHEDILSKGVPDVSFSMPSVSGWIELKTAFTIVKDRLKIRSLTPEQRIWLHKRRSIGGRVWVLCADHDQWIFVNKFFLQLHKGLDLEWCLIIPKDELTTRCISSILGGHYA